MKSVILSSAVVVSCAVMASAAPATITKSNQNLVARGGGGSKVGPVGQKVAQAAEKWALNPQGAMDRDQRKKNREAAVNYATGSGSTIPHRHPELQKAMNANSADGKKSTSKRDVEYLDIRDYGEELATRGTGASKSGASGQKIAKAVEKWALNPQSATDRDQRKKNKESAIDYITGGSSGSATRHRHPEMQKAMNANSASSKSSTSKRDVEYLDIRDYGEVLAARGTGASKSGASGQKIAKAVEKWALNPQSATDRDQRKKNKDSAIDYITGSGSGGAARHRHPELQKAMNANSASSKSSTSKRDVEDLDIRDYSEELATRGTGASKSGASGQKIAKAVEKWALNPQSATDRDQRKKNKESAIDYITGGSSGSATRHRHPEMQKVMNANSAANALASKKYGKSSESSKRDLHDFQVRDYIDLILEVRDFYDLD